MCRLADRRFRLTSLKAFAALILFGAAFGPALGQDRVQALREALQSKDATARLAAATLMSNLAQTARAQYSREAEATMRALREVGPELARLVRDPEPRVRRAAVEALGQTLAGGGVAAPAFEQALRDRSVGIRLAAAEAVGLHVTLAGEEARSRIRTAERLPDYRRLAEDSTAFVKPLDLALRDADADVRAAALHSLIQLIVTLDNVGQVTEGDVRGLTPEEDKIKREAFDGLRKSFEPLARGFDSLMSALNENLVAAEPTLAIGAARTVDEMSRLAESGPATRVLATRGALTRPLLQPEGQAAAGIIQQAVKRTVPALTRALGRSEDQVQLAALEALEIIRPDGADTVSALRAALRDDSPFVRWAAARTLGRIGRPDADVIRGLAHLLTDPDLDVRAAAGAALGQFAEKADAAVPDLSRAVAQGDPDLQIAGIRALRGMGPAVKQAVPALRTALKSPETRVRRAAAELLGELGPASQAAVPALQAALADREPEVRTAAGEAILKILLPR